MFSTLTIPITICFFIIGYVLVCVVLNLRQKKEIEKNKDGTWGGVMEARLQKQDKKLRHQLLGFSPVEAITLLTGVFGVITATLAFVV